MGFIDSEYKKINKDSFQKPKSFIDSEYKNYEYSKTSEAKEPKMPLVMSNGKDFGQISYNAYNAIKNNKIDTYVPVNDNEKAVLDNYKSYIGSQVIDFKLTDGTNLGKISLDAARAIDNDSLNSYTPKNDEEKSAIEKFKQIKANEPKKAKNWWEATYQSIPYLSGKVGTGILGSLNDASDFIFSGAFKLAGDITSLGGYKPNKVSDKMNDVSKMYLNAKNVHESWNEHLDKTYAVPDWVKFTGGIVESGARMLPAIALEAYTGGSSPMLEMESANLMNMTANAAKWKDQARIASVAVKKFLSPSSAYFGTSAAGGYASDAYKKTKDLDKSLKYGAIAGFTEMATEKLFGGFAGTDIGDSVIDFTVKNPHIRKALNLGAEGLEEMIMSVSDPFLRKATEVDEKFQTPSIKEIGESGLSGVLLSVLMGASTYPFQKHQTRQAATVLNSSLESLKTLIPDNNLPDPLNVNKATTQDIEDRQDIIKRASMQYRDLLFETEDNRKKALDKTGSEIQTAITNMQRALISDDDIVQEKDKQAKQALITAKRAQDDYISDLKLQVNDIESVKKGEYTEEIKQRYGNPAVSSLEELSPTHVDVATNEMVRVEPLEDGKYQVTDFNGVKFTKTEQQIQARYEQLSQEELVDIKSKTVSQTVPQDVTKSESDNSNTTQPQNIFTGENEELMQSTPVQRFTNTSSGRNAVALENKLIEQGVNDVERQNILSTLARFEQGAANAGIKINAVVDVVHRLNTAVKDELHGKFGKVKVNLDGNAYNLVMELVTNPDAPITENFVNAFANVWVDLWQESNAMSYNSVVNYLKENGDDTSKEHIAQMLTEYSIYKSIDGDFTNVEVVSKSLFGKMVSEFKGWMSNLIKNIAIIKNRIWKGAGRAFQEQAVAFTNGDWSVVLPTQLNLSAQAQMQSENEVRQDSPELQTKGQNASAGVQNDVVVEEAPIAKQISAENVLNKDGQSDNMETNTNDEIEVDTETINAKPIFKEGDRVKFTDRSGKTLTGTVKSVYDYSDISPKFGMVASVDVDQIATAGGVPIGRIETVPFANLELLDGKNKAGNAQITGKQEKQEGADEKSQQIADFVKSKLEEGKKFNSNELFTTATRVYGDTMANNAFTPKDAYDAMELGVNQFILSLDSNSPYYSAEGMLKLLELLPTQTKRTADMDALQQFSTPPSIAFIANWAANINNKDTMLEPSAGIGGIALFAKKEGATVYVNEYDPRRLSVLKNMPFDGFHNENAEQLDNILGDKIQPSVIVMNPPFSSSAGRNIKGTKIGAVHIEEALKVLAPNGRLVAIVGRGMSDDSASFKEWWKEIKSKYNVRANISIDGKNYTKYGTSFDIQLLVIDKNGTTSQPTLVASVENLSDLQKLLRGIRDDRPTRSFENDTGNEQGTVAAARAEAVKGKQNAGRKREPVVSDTDSDANQNDRQDRASIVVDVQPKRDGNRDNRKSVPDESGETNGLSDRTGSVSSELRNDGGNESGRGTETADNSGSIGSDRGNERGNDGNQRSGRNDVPDRGQSDVPVNRKRGKVKELTDSIFEHYQSQPLLLKNVQSHPASISESAAMSAIEPPSVSYKPNIPQHIIDKGVLSDVQLEAISYAGQSHSQTLANGEARGFFLGDGTGVGKGRTITGIILDNFNNGRKKALWISENKGLVPDAKRDVKALFGKSDAVIEFEGGKKADRILKSESGILFTTYSTMSKGYDVGNSNFEKIVNWLGKDFDGVLVFDEAHNMGNSTNQKGKRGIKKASQRGLAGIAIQKALPKAKIVYSSATGATEVENLRYADRLGLWGKGTAFANGDVFVEKIKAGGLAAMELIARDMKAMGVYLSRNISYENVKYDKLTHNLTKEQTAIYNELARSWQIVLQNIEKALEETNQNKDGTAKGRVYGAFWSSQQRFFNQILTSMQLPSMLADMQKQLDSGNSVVVQLVSTNESAQDKEAERLKKEGLELDDFDLTPRAMLMDYIEKSFPIQQYEEYVDDEGNKKSRPVVDSNGKPVINRQALKAKEALLDRLGSIKVPSSALDMIINHFGTDLVAENTGRQRRIVNINGKMVEENIANKKEADVDAFQNGKKRIIVFSKAGGTGKSYHADKAAKNQQHRVHYLLQAGWQADAAVQGFGRSHRSNQVSAPTFVLVTTNLKGQMRFISTIAKRLDQLGALTKGQRQTGSQGMFNSSDNLENSFASDVLAIFYKDLINNRIIGLDGMSIITKLGLKDRILNEYNQIRDNAQELREVNKFLNRILTLETTEQNAVFDAYAERLQNATENAMQNGTLDRGLENYKADKIILNEVKDIQEDESTGAKTKYYSLTAFNKIKTNTFSEIETSSNQFVGFYQSKNTGNVRAVFKSTSVTDQNGNIIDNYKLIGQVKKYERVPRLRFENNWDKLTNEESKKLWEQEIKNLPEFSEEKLHLISGVVLPVWDKLPTENVRIYRVLTSDGDMLIGRVIPDTMIDETLRRLGSSREKDVIKSDRVLAAVKNGDTVHLDNGWKIMQRRVSNENRIELVGVDYTTSKIVEGKGVFSERISYQTRYFIPTEKDTVEIIDSILKHSPVARIDSNVQYSISDNTEQAKEADIQSEIEQVKALFSNARNLNAKKMVFDETPKGIYRTINGYYDKKTGEIHINLQSAKSLLTIAGHELFHSLPESDQAKLVAFFRFNPKMNTEEFADYKKAKMEAYQKLYDEKGLGKFTEADFWNEFAAENCETLFTNPEYIKKLSRANRNFAQKILDFIRDLWNRIVGNNRYTNSNATNAAGISARQLAQAEAMYAKALGVKSWSLGLESDYLEMTQAEQFVDNVGFGDAVAAYDLGYDEKGNPNVVIITDDIFKGREGEKPYKVIKEYLKNNIGKYATIIESGQKVYFGKDLPGEYTQSNYTKSLKPFNLKAKNEASQNLGEMIEIASNRNWKPNTKEKHKVDAKYGWYKYTSYFQVGNKTFKSDMLIRNDADGKKYLYDLINIKEAAIQSGDKSPYQRTIKDDRPDISGTNGFDNTNIPQDDNGVNTNIRKNDVSYSIDEEVSGLTPERKKEIKAQFDEARVGIIKPTQQELWGERAQWVAHNMTRVFSDIPERGKQGVFFAEFRKMMVQWNNLPKLASHKSQMNLNDMTKDLSPKEFRTFSELVYFLDLQEEAKIQEEHGNAEILLPNEITPGEVDLILKELEKETAPAVTKALETRKKIWKQLKDQYVAINQLIGFDTEGRFERENYYRHQVIEHLSKSKDKGTGSRAIEIKAGRGWLKQRKGSTKAINTDFLAVEHQSLLQMQYDIYIANTLYKIKEQYDIKPSLEKQAFNHNKTLLNEMIAAEASKGDPDGKQRMVQKGGRLVPDSEIYEQQQWYNQRIMFGFSGLFELAKEGSLNDFGGAYKNVVKALENETLNVSGLYQYIGALAGMELDEASSDADKQSVISARTVMKYTSQKKAWIKSLLGKEYQTWESIAESLDGYSIHQPRRGNYFYTKEVIAEDAFNKSFNDILSGMLDGNGIDMNTDTKKLFEQYSDTIRLMGAAFEQWVVPDEIVITMNKVANPKNLNFGQKFFRQTTNQWKGWSTSLNPLRTVKFGVRNMAGDLDAVIAGKPQLLKYAPRAMQEVYQAMRHNKYTPDFEEWMERGGYSSMIFAQEMDTKMQDELFKHLKEKTGKSVFTIPVDILKGYANGVEAAHNFRESILRYSAYLYFKDSIDKNSGVVKDYVASNRFIVNGLKSTEDKAYQLSKDLLGAYDEVNVMGQTLRRYWIPFYSFTETNMKRYYRLFANILASDDSMPKKAAKMILKALQVNLLAILIWAWNNFVRPDDEDKLPPSVRERPHINLGNIGDNVYAFTRLGSFSELLEWIGLDDYKWTKEDLSSPINKVAGMVTPFAKTLVESVSGMSFYPDVTKPRTIRDKAEYFFNALGLADAYKIVAGKPNKGIANMMEGGLIYKYDYQESAYYEILDRKREFQKKDDLTIMGNSEKSNALYYMKLAVKYGDKKAASKYLDKYFEHGGTGKGLNQSFATLNPMYGYTGKDTIEKGKEFLKSLNDNETEKLKIAQRYYETELMLPANITELLKKQGITNEQAKNVLKKYIDAKIKG